ncbi:MAG: HDOD domain-containing protein [Woeseiaceae bacterium]|nr:HDOD domain-containing protein [Woeseiaceae bacterium]
MSAEAMQTAAGFVQELAGDLNRGNLELPMIPDSVVRIQRAFGAGEVDIDEIVRIISSDPAIVARVLQLANSSAIRGAVEIKEVRQAVIRMGNKLVQSSVVAFALSQAQKHEDLSKESQAALKTIWEESVEMAALCYVIAKHHTKLNADEALLMGLLSVIGRLYIFLKSEEFGTIDYTEMEPILAAWHPAISKAIAESWGMSEAIVEALETQMDTDPPLHESATQAEVLSSARVIFDYGQSGEPLDASQYPLLHRLGIANHDDSEFTMEAHAEAIDEIRRSFRA